MLWKVLFVLSASVKTASVNNSGWRWAGRSCWAGVEPATRWRVARSPADDFWQRQRTEGMNKTVQAAQDFHVTQVFQRIEAVGGSWFDLWADDCVNETTLRHVLDFIHEEVKRLITQRGETTISFLHTDGAKVFDCHFLFDCIIPALPVYLL